MGAIYRTLYSNGTTLRINRRQRPPMKDAHGALSRGAKAVQIGSALMKEGPGAFARIQQELTTERTAHETGT
jgi:hypothetical protein